MIKKFFMIDVVTTKLHITQNSYLYTQQKTVYYSNALQNLGIYTGIAVKPFLL